MIASLIIAAISMVLFVYWFRYTCVLILSTKTSTDYATDVATANQLQFLDVSGAVQSSTGPELDRLEQALGRDYRILSFLMDHTADLAVGDSTLEQHILRTDFALMRGFYQISRRVSQSAARSALAEMSQIVAHFANDLGERVAQGSQA